MAAVFDPYEGNALLYFDGQLVAQATNVRQPLRVSAGELRVGDSGDGRGRFVGGLDNVHVWTLL